MAGKILSWDEWQEQQKKNGSSSKTETNADKLLSGSSTGSKSSSSASTSGSKSDSSSSGGSTKSSKVITWDEWQEKMKNPTKTNSVGSAVASAVQSGLQSKSTTRKQTNADKLLNGTTEEKKKKTYGESVAEMMDETVKNTASSIQSSAKKQAEENTKTTVSGIAKAVAGIDKVGSEVPELMQENTDEEEIIKGLDTRNDWMGDNEEEKKTADYASSVIGGIKSNKTEEEEEGIQSLLNNVQTKNAVSTDNTDWDTTGQYGKGNIDLNNRTVLHNDDGTISTEESFSTEIDGKEVLLPTIIDGVRVSEKEAVDHYLETGEYLGKFDNEKDATEYAEELHNRQDQYYGNQNQKSFLDMSMEAQLADEDSELSQLVKADNDLKDQQIESTASNLVLKAMANNYDERQEEAKQESHTWMGSATNKELSFLDVNTVDQDIETVVSAQMSGVYNNGTDVSKMNNEGRAAYKTQLENTNESLNVIKTNLEDKINAVQQRMDEVADTNSWDETEKMLKSDMEAFVEENDEWTLDPNDTTKKLLKVEDYYTAWTIQQRDIKAELESKWETIDHLISNNEKTIKQADYYTEQEDNYLLLQDTEARTAYLAEKEQSIAELETQISDKQKAADTWLENYAAGYDENTMGMIEGVYQPEYQAYMTEIADLQKQIDDKQDEISTIKSMAGILDDDQEDDSSYHAEYYNEREKDFLEKNQEQSSFNTNDIDRIVSFVNKGQEYENWSSQNSYVSSDYSKAMMMTDDEVTQLTELYNDAISNGREPVEAEAYFEALSPYLNERYRPYEEITNRIFAQTEPVTAFAVDVAGAALAPIEALETAWGRLTDAEWVKDPYSDIGALQRLQNDIESAQMENMGEVGKVIYSGALSGFKNYVRGVMYGGAGEKAGEVLNLTHFFCEDYYATYWDKLEETHDDELAGTYAAVDAMISTFFEVFSVEKMYDVPTSFTQYVRQVVGAEMSEEALEATFGPYIHEFLDGQNEWTERAEEYLAQYQTDGKFQDEEGNWLPFAQNYGKAWEMAYSKAMSEWNENILTSSLSAAVSTGGHVAAGTTINSAQIRSENEKIGKAATQSGITEDMSSEEKNKQQIHNEIDVLEAGKLMGENTESGKYALKLEQKYKNGNVVTNAEFGKLVKQIYSDSNSEITNVAVDVLKDKISTELEEKGVEDNGELAALIAKRVIGKDLTDEEKFKLSQNDTAKTVAETYGVLYGTGLAKEVNLGGVSEATKETEEKAANAISAQNTITTLLESNNAQTIGTSSNQVQSTVSNAISGAKYVDLSSAKGLTLKGVRTGSAGAVVTEGDDGEEVIADITGIAMKDVTVTDENGKKKTESKWTVNLSNGQTGVDLSNIQATNQTAADVLAYLNSDQGATLGTNTAKIVIEQALNIKLEDNTETKAETDTTETAAETETETTAGTETEITTEESAGTIQNIKTQNNATASEIITAAVQIAYEENTGLKTNIEKTTTLSTEQLNRIRTAVQKDIQAEQEAEKKTNVILQPGQGTTIIQGTGTEATYGTNGFDKAVTTLLNNKITDVTLRKSIQTEANAIGSIAKSIGARVTLYYDGSEATKGGVTLPDGSIRINLAGTRDNSQAHKSALATFAHEVTHILESSGGNAYNRLRTYVLKNLSNKLNLQDEINHMADVYSKNGAKLTMRGAISEIVAKGCENILTDKETINHIKSTDSTLHKSLKSSISKLVDRIDRLRGDTYLSSTKYGRAMFNVKEMQRELWLGALEETKNKKESGTKGIEQNSIRDEIFNIETEQWIVSENGQQNNTQYSFVDSVNDYIKDHNDRKNSVLALLKNDKMNTEYDARELLIKISSAQYHTLSQYIHNAYEKKGKSITKSDVISFIQKDEQLMKKNASAVVNGWQELINNIGAVSYTVINTAEAEGKNILEVKKKVNSALFGKENNIFVTVKENDEEIRIDRETVKESVDFNYSYKNEKKNPGLTETVLKKADTLLGNSIYIGSHTNYEHKNGEVHYYIAAVKNNNTILPVVFAVHDAIDNQQKSLYDKRAYVAEIYIQNTNISEEKIKDGAKHAGVQKESTGDLQNSPSGASIADIIMAVNSDVIRTYESGQNVQRSIQDDLNAEYEDAVNRGDWRKAEDMLLQKMQNTEGITGYKAPHFYNGEHQNVAKAIKNNTDNAIERAVQDMAPIIPENAVLIPMPPHEGVVKESTDTYILAKALSEATGAPVINALESDYHTSRYQAKSTGDRSVTADSMGFRQVAEIPEGKMPVFIDNMVGGGQTAMAAKNAIGRGITLAYAQSSRAKSQGVKAAMVTYDSNNKLIPLSQRMDPNNSSWKYSIQEMEKTYESLNISPEIMFTGTIEQINAAEKAENERAEEFKKLIERNEFMALEFVKKDGRREILHASTRPGVRYQLSYIGNDGIPTMHENYGAVENGVKSNENIHSMDELYEHFVRENLRSDLTLNVMEDNAGEEIIQEAMKHPVTWFSMQDPVEVRTDGLIAVHNLGEEQLMKVFKLSGFAMPSIAVIRTNYVHNRYGDISVVFYPSTIDPKASTKNKVYSGDAWTPTYPSVEYKVNEKALNTVTKKIKNLVPAEIRNNVRFGSLDVDNLQRAINSNRGDVYEAVKDNQTLQAAYLADNNIEIEYPTRERSLDGFGTFKNDQVLKIVNILDEETIREAAEEGYSYIDTHPEMTEQIRDALNELWKEKHKDVKLNLARRNLYTEENFGASQVYKIISAANSYLNSGIQTELDEYALRDRIRETIDEEEYRAWVEDLFSEIIEKSGIRNNKDYYTNNGNPRSWESLHDEETLDNVVNIMRQQNQKGEAAMFGQSAILALGTKDFRSLSEIRENKEQLQHISDEEMSAAKTDIVNRFGDIMDELSDKSERNQFIARDRVLEAIVDTLRRTRSLNGIIRGMSEWSYNITKETAQEILDLMDEISKLPTEYFEAKPQRAVGTNEIAEIIVPETVSNELKRAMEERNIAYDTYNGTDEDRLRALNSVENAQFSIMDETDYDVAHWMETVPEWSLKTEAEKELLRQYKSLRMKDQLDRERISKVQADIDRIEAIPEENRDNDSKRKLEAYKIKKANIETVRLQTAEKLAKITGSEGFGSMMYRQNQVINDLLYNKTQAEVDASVRSMEQQAEKIQKTIAENQAEVDKLLQSGIVGKLKELLGSTTAEQSIAELKKIFNSTWTKAQLAPYFNEIVLKISSGQDFTQDVETLAGILVNSDSRNNGLDEDLANLRGMTLTISRGQLQELKAQNSSLKEVRARLAGTGITVKVGEYSSLTDNLSDTMETYGTALFQDLGDEKDALENFLQRVESRRDNAVQDNDYYGRIADACEQITAKAVGAAQGVYMPSDKKAQKQVLAIMDYVKALNAQTESQQAALQKIASQMESMKQAGTQASAKTGSLMRDVNVALDYYSRISTIAEQNAKKQKTNAIIEQLKSKQAQQIIKNNEEWRNLIERDRQARNQAEENSKIRNQINTVVKRLYNKMKGPKALDNIPEHMQGLTREVLNTIISNDLDGRKLTKLDYDQLLEAKRVLNAWEERDGKFDIADLKKAFSDNEWFSEIINQDLINLKDGIEDLNREYKGKNKLDTLQQRGYILKRIQEAVSEIYSFIQAEREVNMADHKIAVEDAAYDVIQGTGGKTFHEWTGWLGQKLSLMHKMIVSGNMTPEYFFRTLGNNGLSALWENYHYAENRNGLELAAAKEKLAEIAEKHGYSSWDLKQKITLKLENGDSVQMNIEQLMSLWATWNREKTLGPEMSEHLTHGGFYVEETDLRDGLIGKTEVKKRSHRVSEADMALVASMLTDEQKAYVADVVDYLSNDMSKIGNEASMAAYGIKLYKEKYYYPFKMWDGIKSRKSNDAGSGANNDRAFHPSFSKSRMHGANNALMIGNFTETAADHIAGMINYATMGLANESLNKVLNQTLNETVSDSHYNYTKRNVRAVLEEAYGKTAVEYLTKLQVQLNGGAYQIDKSFYDKLISLFRKNAVAGSLSVALQQPMSYIRAAMMIDTKYLAQALNPETWKGSYAEMMKYSGVAVIKDMGRFDMNFGQSAREYLMPESKQSTGRKIWNGIEEYSTILPELMDRMTWTRMWSAVKAEQAAQHKDMDTSSEEFLQMCGTRFNEVMRRTQVYDSVLVKSANMRSQNQAVKMMTSFMAEPTLTINVLADAVRQVKQGEKGSGMVLAKAGATFLLSAILQSAIKGVMGSGRTPDEKKTWEENFLYRFLYNFLNEADPLQLIPGFSDLITVLKGGELKDDAYGTLKKLVNAITGTADILLGNSDAANYRNWEDSAAQLMQLFTGVPAKNIMRDLRAGWNWFVDQPYAERETSSAVIKGQSEDLFYNADNFIGVVNKWLGEAGFNTDNAGYYERIYEAKKSGNDEAEQDMIDYLINGKGVKEKTITDKMSSLAKKDESMSAAETAVFITDEGKDATDYIREQLKSGELTAAEARKLWKETDPEKDADSIWWSVDRIEYEKETGNEVKGSAYYYRMTDAINSNSAADIKSAVSDLMSHGISQKKILEKTSDWKSEYLAADNAGKVKIRNAIQLVYKYAGSTAEEADKKINKWK